MLHTNLPNEKVTEHFWLHEFIHSDIAQRNKWNNDPPPHVLQTLKDFTIPRAEKIRKVLNSPMYITSGYRTTQVNRVVGGSERPLSQHCLGLAFDFRCFKRSTLLELAHHIVSIRARLPEWDQFILEYNWIHIGFGDRMRGEVLTIQPGMPTKHGLPSFLRQ